MSNKIPFVAWSGDTMPIALRRAQVLGLPFSHLASDQRVVRSEDPPAYMPVINSDRVIAEAVVSTEYERNFYGKSQQELDDCVVADALSILRNRTKPGKAYDSPSVVRDMLALTYTDHEAEVFSITFLTSQLTFIQHVNMFSGTLTQTSVYPREVVKVAMRLNAGAVILCHNHPSGSPEPSRADEHLTSAIKAALALVDVRVVDHVIVGGGVAVSMAERGLL